MKNNKKYESPILKFTSLNTFEDIAKKPTSECWANPAKYSIVDPAGPTAGKIANLKDNPNEYPNGCNANTIQAIKDYLGTVDFDGDKKPDFTSDDITTVFNGFTTGNDGTNMKGQNPYVRS